MLPILSFFYIISGVAALLVILLIIIVMILKKSKKQEEKTEPVNQAFLDQLVSALGGHQNILDVKKEHQRLKVTVKDTKRIQSEALKDLQIAAFLKAKEVTLLIKHQPDKVMSYLYEQRKGV